jgi:hypothetical protein
MPMFRFLTPAAVLAALLFAGNPAAARTVQPSKTTTPSSKVSHAHRTSRTATHKKSHKHGRKVLTKKHQPKRSNKKARPGNRPHKHHRHVKGAK